MPPPASSVCPTSDADDSAFVLTDTDAPDAGGRPSRLLTGTATFMAGLSGALVALVVVLLADTDNPWSGAFVFVVAPMLFAAVGLWAWTHVVTARHGSRTVTPLSVGAFVLLAALTLVDEYVGLPSPWAPPPPTEAEVSRSVVSTYGAEVSLRVGTEHARGPAPDSDPWALTGDDISGVERLVSRWDRGVAVTAYDTSGDGTVDRIDVSDGIITLCWPATVAPDDETYPMIEFDAVAEGPCDGEPALEHPGQRTSD